MERDVFCMALKLLQIIIFMSFHVAQKQDFQTVPFLSLECHVSAAQSSQLLWHPLLLNGFFFIEGAAPLTSDELSSLSPTAAATSSFLKSGMTLTQVKVYSW